MKKLGFGFMRLPLLNKNDPKSIDIPQVFEMVDAFMEKGFTYFDTAYMYHDGISENILNEALVKRYSREKYTVATKMPVMMLKNSDDQISIFEDQLKKVGVDFFDYYLFHSLDNKGYEIAKQYNTVSYLKKKKSDGYIKHLGFSFHDKPEVLDKILSENPDIDFVQLQINYLDWDSNIVQSRKCYEVAKKHNKKVIVMEPVKGGILSNLPKDAKQLLINEHGDWSLASWAIRFAAGLENVSVVLSGMSTIEQVNDNIGFMENFTPLNDNELRTLFKARDIMDSIAVPCTGCRYCIEASSCPENILIPNLFSLLNEQKKNKTVPLEKFKTEYDNIINRGHGRAADCIKCRKCEKVCPQHINIPDNIEKVSNIFDID